MREPRIDGTRRPIVAAARRCIALVRLAAYEASRVLTVVAGFGAASAATSLWMRVTDVSLGSAMPLRRMRPMPDERGRARARTLALLVACLCIIGCRDARMARARHRVLATRTATDSVERVWKRAVGVDSMAMSADTAVLWVSPTNWLATDAPKAIVHVAPDGRIARIEWVAGG